MSDQDGKQLSMEETVEDVETKPDELDVKAQTEEGEKQKSEVVRKVRATRSGTGKQLALEESLGEGRTGTTTKEKTSHDKRQTRAKGRERQTTLDETLGD